MDIISMIPIGHDNGVTLSDLVKRTGAGEREIRNAISKARNAIVIVNLQDGKGYFIPTEKEAGLAYKWLKQEEARERNHRATLKGARKFLNSRKGL